MIHVGKDAYVGDLLYEDEFHDLANWRQLERDGVWEADPRGVTGRWVRNSPSLFFGRRIEGDYLWQTSVRRLRPTDDELERMRRHTHWQNADALHKYNYNFWIRADDPSGGDFLEVYPTKLGTGWNGMGDDYWNSLFSTVVWSPGDHWVRLRRSPGYVKERDVQDVVPHQPYDVPHSFSFVVHENNVRMYWNDQRIYDWNGEGLPGGGYIGLCVWLCAVRFEEMRLYRLR